MGHRGVQEVGFTSLHNTSCCRHRMQNNSVDFVCQVHYQVHFFLNPSEIF